MRPGFGDVVYETWCAVQSHALKAGARLRAVRARDATQQAATTTSRQFFEQVMAQNSKIAAQCHEFLGKVQASEDTGAR